ncbi:MAG TPA: hypothetical protein VGP64_17555 [Polyangia bacterium]|jgi:hypothetical protein
MRQVSKHVVLGSLGLASIGCLFGPIEAVNRASREFSCPRERIAAVQRGDIATNVYDLNVCGVMVRYSCISGENTPVQCTREPPPPHWDLDPALVPTIPRPPGVPLDLKTPSVCGSEELDVGGPCLERSGAGWRWRERVAGPGPMGAAPRPSESGEQPALAGVGFVGQRL